MSTTSPVPVNPSSKSGTYSLESNTFSSISDLFRFFQSRRMKISKNSPPVLNVDVTEGEIVWDRTANRLYTVSNQALRYVAFT